MRQNLRATRTAAGVAILIVGAFTVTACSDDEPSEPAQSTTSAASSTTPPVVETIIAKGTRPAGEAPIFGDALPNGALPFTSSGELKGDLTGDVEGSGTVTIDETAKTYTLHKTTSTFTGDLVAIGRGSFTFVVSSTATPFGGEVTAKGTVSDGTDDLKGWSGTIVEKYKVSETGEAGPGTYTVTVKTTS
jgi:hypothetical protein